MRFILSCAIIAVVFGCSILEAAFPIEWPQRYIDREVEASELVGVWKITKESEASVNEYFRSDEYHKFPASFPWRQITLRDDQTCSIVFEKSWAAENSILNIPEVLTTCKWRIIEVYGTDGNDIFFHVPGLEVGHEYYNEKEKMLYLAHSEMYIVEENNELVLWEFIGMPHEGFIFQDFHKVKTVKSIQR